MWKPYNKNLGTLIGFSFKLAAPLSVKKKKKSLKRVDCQCSEKKIKNTPKVKQNAF